MFVYPISNLRKCYKYLSNSPGTYSGLHICLFPEVNTLLIFALIIPIHSFILLLNMSMSLNGFCF